MTMDCDAVTRMVERWQRGEEMDRYEALAAADHAGSCGRCSVAYGTLIPLLLRDSTGPRAGDGDLSAGLEQAIMERIARSPGPVRRPRPSRGGFRTALAIAAAVLVALGTAGVLFQRLRSTPPGGILTVTFVLEAPDARSVAVVGDFTNWQSEGYELSRRCGDEAWAITLQLRKDATYTYCFLIDGREWIPDPHAPETVDDGFGGVDSVLRL